MSGVAFVSPSAGREVIHLSPGAPLVPDALLEPPWRSDSRGTFRDLAALLLDGHLRRLVRIRQPIDLRLARLLHRLESGSGYLALGFARLTDYTTERLGLPVRRVQTLLALARRLGDLPRLATAFEAGHVSLSQVQLLLRVVTPDTEGDWVARATAMTVRRLEAAVRAAERSAAGTKEAEPAPSRETSPAVDEDPAVAGEFITFTAPSCLRARWEQALELARRSSGATDPTWQSVEFIAAEYLSGAPDIALSLSRSVAARAEGAASAGDGAAEAQTSAAGAQTSGPGAQTGAPGTDRHGFPADCGPGGTAPADESRADEPCAGDGVDLYEEVLAALAADPASGSSAGAGGGPGSGAGFADASWPDDCPRIVLPDAVLDEPAGSPRDLDARLRELIRLRQGVSWSLGRLLRTFADRRLYREFGLLSLSRYCRERLGLGVRRAWQLISLERRLFLLPATACAYRGGALSWVQASAIARVATEGTEKRWLRLATSVSVRRLLEEVAVSEAGGAPAGPAGLDSEGRVQLSAPLRTATAPRMATPPRTPAPAQTPAPGQPHLTAPDAAPPDPVSSDPEPADPAPADLAPGDPAPADPAPADTEPRTRIRFWAPHEVALLWHEALVLCRVSAGRPLGDAECVDAILDAFFATWGVRADAAWRRKYRIFERDGWRCRVPGCTSRRNLQVHHVIFRSHGGSDDDANLVVLCAAHHLQCIHRGWLRCHALPHGLLAWELAPDPERGSLVAYVEDVLWSAARAAVHAETREAMPAEAQAAAGPHAAPAQFDVVSGRGK
jgi:hypothetical protein